VISSLPSGQRISTRLGSIYPAIRVTLIGGATSSTEQVWRPDLQLDCCGDGTGTVAETQAAYIANLVYNSIPTLAGTYATGVIAGAHPNGFILHSAFSDTGRERYIVSLGLLIQDLS
jgi:hypothetical protein